MCGDRGHMGTLFSTQFCCRPKIALKIKFIAFKNQKPKLMGQLELWVGLVISPVLCLFLPLHIPMGDIPNHFSDFTSGSCFLILLPSFYSVRVHRTSVSYNDVSTNIQFPSKILSYFSDAQ